MYRASESSLTLSSEYHRKWAIHQIESLPDSLALNIALNPDGLQPGAQETVGDCWQWTGTTQKGYGPHRLIYEILRTKVGRVFVLDHLCRNRGCVNPDHLEPVTTQENIQRGQGARGFLTSKERQELYELAANGPRHPDEDVPEIPRGPKGYARMIRPRPEERQV